MSLGSFFFGSSGFLGSSFLGSSGFLSAANVVNENPARIISATRSDRIVAIEIFSQEGISLCGLHRRLQKVPNPDDSVKRNPRFQFTSAYLPIVIVAEFWAL